MRLDREDWTNLEGIRLGISAKLSRCVLVFELELRQSRQGIIDLYGKGVF